MDQIKTRFEYLDGAISHREYYAQFVTKQTRDEVERSIGKEALLNSTDEHLNDIKLGFWNLIPKKCDIQAFRAATIHGMSQSEWVCIAKEAARQLIESYAV